MANRNNNWRMKQLLATLIYSLSHKLSNLKQIVIKDHKQHLQIKKILNKSCKMEQLEEDFHQKHLKI